MGQLLLGPDARILFQGDSITDAGRSRTDDGQLGGGYANIVAASLGARYPERRWVFLNRGISGNRMVDMEARWTEDCIALQPDWVSILIGINDTWRRYDSGVHSPVEEFEAGYRRLLDRIKAETSARILLMEPFVLPTPPDRIAWREDLDPRIEAVRTVAREYEALLLPLDGIFAAASARRAPAYWAHDGVHPTQVGHALIAQSWIRAVHEE